MTKVIVIGESQPRIEGKIVFTHYLNGSYEMIKAESKPSDYNFIELITRNYGGGDRGDLMFAYNDLGGRDHGVLYVGHFNNGLV